MTRTNPTLLVTGATLPDGTRSDIVVTNGRIAQVGTGLTATGATVIDADGLTALPGLVDLHTHLREPGFEQSETVLTGSRAAAIGGFTAVHAMANTSPVADTAGVVEQVASLGERHGYATVRPIGAVTVGLEGERLSEIGAMAQSRAQVSVFSDDGKCVHDALLMRRALEYVKTFDGVIAQHAQEPRLTEGAQMNEGALSGELGLGGWPAVAEESIIARDVLLAHHVGARLHVCHVSTAGSVEVVRWAKARGISVTAEVTPHHLLLTEELVRGYDSRYKVNPPLRRDEDVLALRAGLADGTIDIVATDHAPHPLEAKECAWAEAAMGMVGLESALSVVQAAVVDSGQLGWADVARVLSEVPASIGRLDGYSTPFAVGNSANFTLYDPSVRRRFSREHLHGKGINSPYLGTELPGQVMATIHNGYSTVLNGALVEASDVAASAAVTYE
jgi:dihydroorotase